MVLKQCQSRFKVLGANHPERWSDLSFTEDRRVLLPAPARVNPSGLRAVTTSSGVRCTAGTAPPVGTSLWTRRPPNVRHLPAVTQVYARGNFVSELLPE